MISVVVSAIVVAFSAYISDEPSVKASAHSVVPFKGVLTNVGGGYSLVLFIIFYMIVYNLCVQVFH